MPDCKSILVSGLLTVVRCQTDNGLEASNTVDKELIKFYYLVNRLSEGPTSVIN